MAIVFCRGCRSKRHSQPWGSAQTVEVNKCLNCQPKPKQVHDVRERAKLIIRTSSLIFKKR